jgi:hypothetical protein
VKTRNGNLRLCLLLITGLAYIGYCYDSIASHFPSDWSTPFNFQDWLCSTAQYLQANVGLAILNQANGSIFQPAITIALLIASAKCFPRELKARHLLLLYPITILIAVSMWDAYCFPLTAPMPWERYPWQAHVLAAIFAFLSAPCALLYILILKSSDWSGERWFASYIFLCYLMNGCMVFFWQLMFFSNEWL